MSKTRKPHKMRWTYRHQSLGAWVILGLGLTALIGCSTTPAPHSGDPLFGEYYPKGPNGQPLPPPNPAQKTTSIGVPPYPVTNSASSTAAIATNTALPGGRPLAINEKNGLNGSLTNTSGTVTAGVGIGTPIVQPIPRDTTGPVAVANPGGTSTAAIATNLGNASTPVGTIIPTGSWSAPTQTPATAAPASDTVPVLRTSTGTGLIAGSRDDRRTADCPGGQRRRRPQARKCPRWRPRLLLRAAAIQSRQHPLLGNRRR